MKAILHCDKDWGIGRKNGLMFDIPADMEFFRTTTLGHTVVMGSNTLLSFPGSKPLKNRDNIVLWPGGQKRDDCTVVESLDELFKEIKKYPSDEVFIIGGAMMYKTMLPYCDEVLITKVDAIGDADTFFENLDASPDFKLESVSEPEVTNGYTVRFCTYKNLHTKSI